MDARQGSGLRAARFFMVLGSLSPLFILWAIRGAHHVPDKWWVSICLTCAIIPNVILYWRWHIARSNNDHRVLIVKSAKDQSEHLLVYLFAMLIPLFGVDLGGARDIAAVFAAFIFIVFMFLHMNLHYMNIVFAFLGYHVFTVEAARSVTNQAESESRQVVILSKRSVISPSTQLDVIRLSNTVFIE